MVPVKPEHGTITSGARDQRRHGIARRFDPVQDRRHSSLFSHPTRSHKSASIVALTLPGRAAGVNSQSAASHCFHPQMVLGVRQSFRRPPRTVTIDLHDRLVLTDDSREYDRRRRLWIASLQSPLWRQGTMIQFRQPRQSDRACRVPGEPGGCADISSRVSGFLGDRGTRGQIGLPAPLEPWMLMLGTIARDRRQSLLSEPASINLISRSW
jgi:hypothetical protein